MLPAVVLPAVAGPAGAVLVTTTSAEVFTADVTEPVLLAVFVSVELLLAVAELVIAVPVKPGLARTTRVKVGAAPLDTVARVLVTVPVPPTPGVVFVQPF